MLKERQADSPFFNSVSLTTFLCGVLSGIILAFVAAIVVTSGIKPFPIPSEIDQDFAIKLALSACSAIITMFAVVMTIRSQIRQRALMYDIDTMLEETSVLSHHVPERDQP
jgi:hypothetical protein